MTKTLEPIQDEQFWIELENEELRRKGKGKSVVTTDTKLLVELMEALTLDIPVPGTIVSAKYLGIQSDQHTFDVSGYKDEIRVDNRPSENKYLKNVKVGDSIDVLIDGVDHQNFSINGTISGIYETRVHDLLKSKDSADLVVTATIKSLNPAGYEVEILQGGIVLDAFMPNTLAGINKLHNPESIVGQTFEVMIESFSKEEGTYIVSRRKYLRTLIPQAIESLQKYTTGVSYRGHVTGTTPFGIFVEFNDCLTGMIHKANVLEDYQDKLDQIPPGTEIAFYVKEILKDDKIILTQTLRESLWDSIKPGQTLDGEVRATKQFGVLVSLDDETMGLIHTSEVEKLKRKFTNGEKVKVKVLHVERQNRKIFLTAL
jgi:small subunit ribosomal protein S1